MKKIFAVICILMTAFIFMYNFNNKESVSNVHEPYCNTVDGYYFDIPENYTADSSFYPVTMTFNSSDTTIEIYAQDYGYEEERLNYIGYTTRAITENTIDFENINSFTDAENNCVLSWNRKKLSRIKNDKNYYLKLDITREPKVYTLLVKSTKPISDYTEYLSRISFHDNIIPAEPTDKKTPRIPKFTSETKDFYNKYLSKESKLTWGIYPPQYMDNDELYKYEEEINHHFEIMLWYTAFSKEYDPDKMLKILNKAHSDGKTVELSLQPLLSHEKGNDLFRLLDGYYDDFLDKYAKDIADFGHPVMFRFANEMNGDWCEYSGYKMSLDTSLYREMYRYVYSFFEKHNANNVIWVWNPNGKSFPYFKWNSEEMYYPGNDYVDVLGLTLYNTGTFYPGETWSEFEALYTPLYENSMRKYDMPFIITEFACAREGGNKEEWTRKMFNQISDYPNIKIAIWWDGCDFTPDGNISRAYFIDDSDEMKEIFKNYFNK